MWLLISVLVLSAGQSSEAPSAAVAPTLLGVCDGLGFAEMRTFVVTAAAQVKVVNAISNSFARSIAQRAVCSSLMSRDDSPAKCLTDMFVNKSKAVCMALGQCDAFDLLLGQLCEGAELWTCKPPVCQAEKPLEGILVGCYDVHAADDNGAVVRRQFDPKSSGKTTAARCAVECAGSMHFYLEDGRCACGEFNATKVADLEVEAGMCGEKCRGESPDLLNLPCGRRERLAVFITDKVAELSNESHGQHATGRALSDVGSDGSIAYTALTRFALALSVAVAAIAAAGAIRRPCMHVQISADEDFPTKIGGRSRLPRIDEAWTEP
ncbi:hypothetical protein T492DRAFT_1086499 [Pavlovales sp. CCMP2436]|nr:hypothetical protein T492DRAFT_1086499 [Pavlovales sp. CCMP2436]